MTDLWPSLLQRVSGRIGPKSYRDWFAPSHPLALTADELVIGVPNMLFREWMEKNFRVVIEDVLATMADDQDVSGPVPRAVRFEVQGRESASTQPDSPGATPMSPSPVGAERAPGPGGASSSGPGGASGAGHGASPFGPAGASAVGNGGGSAASHGVASGTSHEAVNATSSGLRRRLALPRSSGRATVSAEPGRDFGVAPFNPRYTFENFVVGSCNQFAHAAARAVADNPGQAYNPLFLYGGVGLGKTHLMQAVGHALRTEHPGSRVAYVSAERFMCEMINAIRYKRTPEFREKFRNIDALLVDDIQFLEGKEATQEEFFHTFRHLYEDGKQIVLSSDCPPREIATLEDRLRSRFESGLLADMQVPDLETKLAILRRKAESEGTELRDDVAMFLASRVRSNVRELEGCLTRLLALASLRQQAPDLDVAREATRDFFPDDAKPVTVEAIQRYVANYYNVRVADLKARNNARVVAFPRQVAMYLCKRMTKSSFPDIGKKFGGKHHSTVIHSVNKISAAAAQSEDLNHLLNKFVEDIR